MRLPWDGKQRAMKAEGRYVRERSADLYHTWRWTKLSKSFRSESCHQLCAECARQGRITVATCVDHIVPYPICGEDGFFDRNNLQPLCDDCNALKGNLDKMAIKCYKQGKMV